MTRRTTRVREKQEEVVEDSDSNNNDDVDLACKALLEAVEIWSASNNNDEATAATDSLRPFLRLFVASPSSGRPATTKQLKQEKLNPRYHKKLLFRAIQGFPKATARRFFAALREICSSVIAREAYLPESAFFDDDDDDDNDAEVTSDAPSSENLQFLNYATLCVKAYVDGQVAKKQEGSAAATTSTTTKLSIIDEVFQLTQSLHDILFSLNSGGPDAVEPQASIVLLCETWWTNNCEYKERVVLQALPLIVYWAIHGESKSSVKRLFQIRHAIAEIDFGDTSSNELKAMLLRLASSPKILKLPEGKKILSYLMQLDKHLLVGLHKAIRAQIPHLRHPLLQALGESYFRAWKDAPSPEVRAAIEALILNDLVITAIQVARPNVLKALLVVLEPFHSEKKTPDVEKLLHHLYSGMLWRSLSTSNGRIRANATHIFAKVFPLRDSSSMQTEEAIRKGCDSLEALLQDPDPKVRMAASQAVAQILGTYWVVLPPKKIRELLNFLMDHISDRSSSAVRAASVDAVTAILDAPQSHAVLRPLLPLFGNLIHDRVERVRLAVVRMLLKVKGIHGIKYYHVVPASHLTCRLVADGRVNAKGQVASALTGLMVNSFCPHGPNTNSLEQIKRAVKFLKKHPSEACVFYNNLSQHIPVSSVAKLAANLFHCVHTTVTNEGQQQGGDTSHERKRHRRVDDNDENELNASSSYTQLLAATDTKLMSNLVETVSTLWQSIEVRLQHPAQENSRDILVKAVSGNTALLDVLSYFESSSQEGMETEYDDEGHVNESTSLEIYCHRASASILSCAGRLPADAIHGLVPHILNVLSSLSREAPPTINVTSHIALLCIWNMTDDVASALASSIESSFEDDFSFNFASPEAGSKKRKSSRNGGKNNKRPVVPGMPPRVALEILSDLLVGSDPIIVSARASILSSQTACEAIERALDRGTRYAERILQPNENRAYATHASEDEIAYIVQLCETHGRFAFHKEAVATESGGQASRLLEWTTTVVIPWLVSSGQEIEQAPPFVDPDLSRISFEKSFANSPIPTGPPRRRLNHNNTPVRLDGSSSTSFAGLLTPQSSPRSLEISKDFAFSLVHSCLVLCAERVAAGGAADTDKIAEVVQQWTAVFENGDYDDRHQVLLSAFCRLALLLCKKSSSFALLQSLIAKFQERYDDDGEIGPVAAVVSKLLSTRGDKNAIVAGTVQCVLGAIHTLLLGDGVTTTLGPELPASLCDLWPNEKGCVRSTVRAILSSKVGSVELGSHIVNSFEKHRNSEPSSVLIFYAKCLCVLCDIECTRPAPEIVNMIRGLDIGALNSPEESKAVLEKLQAGLE